MRQWCGKFSVAGGILSVPGVEVGGGGVGEGVNVCDTLWQMAKCWYLVLTFALIKSGWLKYIST